MYVMGSDGGGSSTQGVGYNAEQASALANSITNNSLVTFQNDMAEQSKKIIENIKSRWSSPNAVSFFNTFGENMNILFREGTGRLENVVDTINSGASAWASKMGNQFTPAVYRPRTFTLDVSQIQDKDSSGGTFVDPTVFEDFKLWLTQLKDTTDGDLGSALTAMDSSPESFDVESMETLRASLKTIKGNLNRSLEEAINLATEAAQQHNEALMSTYSSVKDAFDINRVQ